MERRGQREAESKETSWVGGGGFFGGARGRTGWEEWILESKGQIYSKKEVELGRRGGGEMGRSGGMGRGGMGREEDKDIRENGVSHKDRES